VGRGAAFSADEENWRWMHLDAALSGLHPRQTALSRNHEQFLFRLAAVAALYGNGRHYLFHSGERSAHLDWASKRRDEEGLLGLPDADALDDHRKRRR
tara:strand:- start:337 stop:630 length:294 start_codon:yes stop_codon:yes gene_type:complete